MVECLALNQDIAVQSCVPLLNFMSPSHIKGNQSTAFIIAALLESGYTVSVPFGDGCAYDLLIDDGSSIKRVQCKTAHIRNHCVIFKTHSVNGTGTGKIWLRRYRGLADLFAAYCPANRTIYLVPVDEAPVSECRLRLTPAANNQQVGVRSAVDYKLATVA